MRQTAVEYLQECLSISLGIDRMRLLENLFERAKEMERGHAQLYVVYCLTSIKSNDVVQFFDEIVAGNAPLERDLNSKNETYVTAWQILEGGKKINIRT